jgi:phosphopantothenoylcysteine decarboxylase / phosphopantothenate---cysteine ligase
MPIEPDRHYVRNPMASAVTTSGRAVFVMQGEEPQHASEVDAVTVSAIWESLATPVSGADLAARAAKGPGALAGLFESLVERAFLLRGTPDELREWATERVPSPGMRVCRHLVLGVTGAVQAVFAPVYVQRLTLQFAERLDIVLTPSAGRFVRPRALAILGAEVWSDPFERRGEIQAPHIHLAAADLVVVLPASAHAIFRLASGAASDLLSLVVCATRAPVVVVPSMHLTMWHHPAVQRNVETLRRDGAFVLEPGLAASVGEAGPRQVGGAGLGADGANLIGALEAILVLSRSCTHRGYACHRSAASSE